MIITQMCMWMHVYLHDKEAAGRRQKSLSVMRSSFEPLVVEDQ